jgi:hypothetical protein
MIQSYVCTGILWFLVFLDGVLTYIGLTYRGFSEGNFLLAMLMSYIGVIPALIASRLWACAMIYVIHVMAQARGNFLWLVQGFIIAVYLTFSIIPWVNALI